METHLEINPGIDQILQGLISESPELKTESEKKINLFLKSQVRKNKLPANRENEVSINNKPEEVFQERGEYIINEFASIYFQGVQYLDLKNVYFINNTGIANLIDLLKSLLQQGVVIKFVNVRDKIKNKFKSMGLEYIFNCS